MSSFQLPVAEKYHQNIVVLQLVKKQIEKDFGIEEDEIKLSENKALLYQGLCSEVERIILYLINNNTQRLMNLLYRVDVPEAVIKGALIIADDESAEKTISQAIMKRELMKVITRLYFSADPNQKLLLKI